MWSPFSWTRDISLSDVSDRQHLAILSMTADAPSVVDDGKMPPAQRQTALAKLKSDPKVTIGLFSFHAGGAGRCPPAYLSCRYLFTPVGVLSTGLNLTSANHVILMDLWWNPALEDQAFDRVYR